MACFNGRHDLTEIMRKADSTAPAAANVVRWCVQCGAIVVDDDVDGQTYPGGFMPMKLPRIARRAEILARMPAPEDERD